MGKSNKKAKSDRINALRKQYDAFLEEDKKRKERNDFILGRLDKMRCTTALVPARYKPRVFETRPAVVDRLGFKPEFSPILDYQTSITNQIQLVPDIQVNNNEDAYLIQEISKKYILIPKLTTFMNNCIRNGPTNDNRERLQEMHIGQDAVPDELKPNSHDSTDWKSKYEILKILKDEEKGKSTGNYLSGVVDLEQSVSKESSQENNQDKVAINYDNYVNTDAHVDIPKNYVNEYPEKDLPALPEDMHYGLPNDNGYSLNNTVFTSEVIVANTETNENNNVFVANVDQADAISDQLQNVTLQYKHSDVPNIDISREESDYHEPKLVPDVDVNMSSILADDYPKQSQQINEKSFNVEDEYPVVASSLIHSQNEQYDPTDSEQVYYAGEPTDSEQIVYAGELTDSKQAVYAGESTDSKQVVYAGEPTDSEQIVYAGELTDSKQAVYAGESTDSKQAVYAGEPTDSEQVVYAGDHEISPMEAVNYNSPSTLEINDHIAENENFVEPGNDQEFAPNIGVQLKTDATDFAEDQIHLNSNVDAIGEAQPVIEKTENQEYVTESIEDFDAEQREMFYSEQTGDNYNSQHEQPSDYSQNEYSQNQEYAYYENTEGVAYPVELNDEEVTEKYDPIYEQQYTGLDQAAEQQQYVEEYQEPEKFTDEANHQFEVLQYEQQFENQGNIEESLDSEDGYTAQKSEAPPAEKPIDAV